MAFPKLLPSPSHDPALSRAIRRYRVRFARFTKTTLGIKAPSVNPFGMTSMDDVSRADTWLDAAEHSPTMQASLRKLFEG